MSTNQSSWPDSGQNLRHHYVISVAKAQTFLLVKLSRGEERGETAVFAGYIGSSFLFSFILWQSLWKEDTLGSSWTTVINFITTQILFFVNHLLIQRIGHLPDSNNLLLKMRPNMKMSLIFMRMRSHCHIKGFAVTLVLKQRLVIIR